MIRSQNGCGCSDDRVESAGSFGGRNDRDDRCCRPNLLSCAACGLAGTIFRIVRGIDRTLGGCGCGRDR